METSNPNEEACMNTSTPVLPLVANGYGHHHNHGIEGKDAVLIHSNQTALNSTMLNESVSRNSKEDVIKVLESGCANERAILTVKSDLADMIRTEATRTREFLQQQELARLVQASNDGKFDALTALISKLLPTK